jgi:hypothetical protein
MKFLATVRVFKRFVEQNLFQLLVVGPGGARRLSVSMAS